MTRTAVIDTITYELVVFERMGDEIRVRLRGMTASARVELVLFDDGRRAVISPMGSCLTDRVREYDLVETVEAVPGKRIEVRGLHRTEVVMTEDLAEGYPVVCSADPTAPGLPDEFLHRRGDRYVLMGGERVGPRRATVSPRTTLVA